MKSHRVHNLDKHDDVVLTKQDLWKLLFGGVVRVSSLRIKRGAHRINTKLLNINQMREAYSSQQSRLVLITSMAWMDVFLALLNHVIRSYQ